MKLFNSKALEAQVIKKMSKDLIKVEHLKQWFPAGGFGKNKRYVKAVDEIDDVPYVAHGEKAHLSEEIVAWAHMVAEGGEEQGHGDLPWAEP